ncbi:uncharacterized protein LTR77_006612 [Saxophila tyrrhenica]|uniref:Trafficking protein particle complex II-specific subunit 65 IgD3 domain-containing protein n=1 Tax=Saxophila tyrrhenica TaxID=1690608 RepID=A0AAV9P5A7_9PEZI|nr:hypothetical protein LTR77_006612 [Saxophila tyrrhenica]
MSTARQLDVTKQFKTFSSGARLDVLILESGGDDILEVLRDGSSDDVSRSPPRRHLYFDEKARVTVLLRTSGNKDELRKFLPQVEISLAAHATDAVPQGSGNAASASGKHDLTSRTIPGGDLEDIVVSGDYLFAIWRPSLHLPRPQVRLQRPAVYFTANLKVSRDALNASRRRAAETLESYEPLPANVLEPLHTDPAFGDSGIYLSEGRIAKSVGSNAQAQDDVKPIRGATKRAFPIVPALFTRIRCSVLPDALIASLHLEASRLITGTLTAKDVTVDVPGAQVESLCPLDEPKDAKAGDEIILLYKFAHQRRTDDPALSSVFVRVGAMLAEREGSSIDLETKWQTKVDLSSTASKPSYRWSRPLSTGSQQAPRLSLKDAAPPSMPETELKPSTGETGVVFNITAPATVSKDDTLVLDLQCINRSDRKRRFALIALRTKKTPPNGFAKEQRGSEDTRRSMETTKPEPSQRKRRLDVLDLYPDFRIGPVAPGASLETKLRYRTLTMGILDLGAIRIVDLDTRQTVDVKNLPDVIVMNSTSQEESEKSAGKQQD